MPQPDPQKPSVLSRIRQMLCDVGVWIVAGSVVGGLCGVSSAAFLWLLDIATHYRGEHIWLVYLLPVAGAALGLFLSLWGSNVLGGNNLILDTLHVANSERLPKRMTPIVLLGSVITHLFGGSAGREGTAVQMGGSLADRFAHLINAQGRLRVELISAGIAGGFGAVFGTPFAGAVFAMEVVRIGQVDYHALVPALVAAIVGDLTTRGLGIHHTEYPVVNILSLTPPVLGKLLVLSAAVACASAGFIELTHWIKATLKKRVPNMALRMALGGAAVVAMWQLSGTDMYLGLGVPTIVDAFRNPDLPRFAFLLKLIFTAVTLGAGFLGGEVTPLFFIGAALGNSVGQALGLPLDLAAACGFAAVFGAAANTPLACAIMAVELFGAAVLPHVAIVCVLAYLMTGHRGIYPSQRIRVSKHGEKLESERTLHEFDSLP